jgi:hypothetical protein
MRANADRSRREYTVDSKDGEPASSPDPRSHAFSYPVILEFRKIERLLGFREGIRGFRGCETYA